ncbi:unnamed protein product [Didymodactylos carnosus]|uniref:MYND-type domain-containing protein n=1 Tax=Didymodactylos carnosus TaxID=1234261 RepID=A0A815SK22_9BILA|nr:unnamed protein product [Didymodactylos carnosus]CAF1489129.1 unnamed protein product [Didymodactylos carnosus]CAF4149373.1 unnamed protein product [Didymodactylos carnosus]CAF4352491.1 unnamed protein product [Didymodactylos carnosus]
MTPAAVLKQLGINATHSQEESIKASKEVVAAYEYFLQKNPPDHRKVPEVHYCLGCLACFDRNLTLATFHLNKAKVAENPSVRLPCFEPVGYDFEPKVVLEMFVNNPENFSLSNNTMQTPDGHSVVNRVCNHCGKENPPKRCPCGSVNYCNTECQQKHWKVHKSDHKQK